MLGPVNAGEEITYVGDEGQRVSKWLRRQEHDDILSSLPDELLLHILSFLPMKECVKTGVLSKRWNFLWTFVSTLTFHNNDLTGNEIARFANFVGRTLTLCSCGTIKKFSLRFCCNDSYFQNLDLWLQYATQKCVAELDLRLELDDWFYPLYKFPQHLYSSPSLTSLSLSHCILTPSSEISWKSLRYLSLENMELKNFIIEKILSGCPILESLTLRAFAAMDPLVIFSESLKVLKIESCWSARRRGYWLVIRTPRLQSLCIVGNCSQREFQHRPVPVLDHVSGRKRIPLLMRTFTSLGHIKELIFGSWCLQALSLQALKGVPCSTFDVKYLTLHTGPSRCDMPGIARLLINSPFLETLVIDMSQKFYDDEKGFSIQRHWDTQIFDEENYWTSLNINSKKLFLCLKTVQVINFRGSRIILPLLKFLLCNARVLDLVDLNLPGRIDKTLSCSAESRD